MMNGYSVEEVDDFLDELTVDYEKIYKEVAEAKNKIEDLQESMEKYKNIEGTLQNTLVMAQSAADEVKKLAKQQAEQMINEAQATAKQAVTELEQELTLKKKEMEEVQAPFVFAEVPLLFEGKFDSRFDRILVVLREKHSRIHAIMKRDRLKETCIIARMNNQFDYDRNKEALTKNRKVFLINNNDSQEALEKEVSNFLKSIGFDCETNSVKQ